MRILIVDDSKAMRMIVQRTLKQAGFADHPTAEAGNGREALAILRRERFDLVLCDWNMPEMSGIELLGVVTHEKLVPRFGFVTSEATVAMRQHAADAGASFLIGKPFTVEVFQQTLNGVLAA